MAASNLNLNVSNEPDQRNKNNDESKEEADLCDRKQYERKSSNQRLYDNCTKNPNHDGFISEREFIRQGPSCLPEGYTDKSIFDFIKAQATLTAKLTVHCVSQERPDAYPLADYKRNSNISFPGTGMVVRVERQTMENGQLCPCSECKSSSTVCNCKELFTLVVKTARHVVYDKMEGDKTTLRLSYFTGEEEKEVTLSHGIHSVISSDQSALSLTTHDKHLGSRLIEALGTMRSLVDCVAPLFNRDNDQPFSPIVSYPHGCDKQVSFGSITKCNLKEIPGGVEYNTPTCPGSAGAAIFSSMNSDASVHTSNMLCYHHEGHHKITGNNVSGNTSSPFEDHFADQRDTLLFPQDAGDGHDVALDDSDDDSVDEHGDEVMK